MLIFYTYKFRTILTIVLIGLAVIPCALTVQCVYNIYVCFRSEQTMEIKRRFRRSGKHGTPDGQELVEKRKYYHCYIIFVHIYVLHHKYVLSKGKRN